jgi:hypothetical protein
MFVKETGTTDEGRTVPINPNQSVFICLNLWFSRLALFFSIIYRGLKNDYADDFKCQLKITDYRLEITD